MTSSLELSIGWFESLAVTGQSSHLRHNIVYCKLDYYWVIISFVEWDWLVIIATSQYQQGYPDGENLKKHQCHYQPKDVSNLFAPHYCPGPMDHPLQNPYSLEIHVPNFDPQIKDLVQWKKEQERCRFRSRIKLIHGPSVTLDQLQTYFPSEQAENIFFPDKRSVVLPPWDVTSSPLSIMPNYV